jgi:hypothetical protein
MEVLIYNLSLNFNSMLVLAGDGDFIYTRFALNNSLNINLLSSKLHTEDIYIYQEIKKYQGIVYLHISSLYMPAVLRIKTAYSDSRGQRTREKKTK